MNLMNLMVVLVIKLPSFLETLKIYNLEIYNLELENKKFYISKITNNNFRLD